MQPDFKMVAAASLGRAKWLVPQWLPQGRRAGGEWQAVNPMRPDRHIGSFSVNLLTGRWADFATSDAGGDLISLYAFLNRLTYPAAAKELAGICGESRALPLPKPQPDPRQAYRVKQIWEQSLPLTNDCPASLYLKQRGIEPVAFLSSLRWQPSLWEQESRATLPTLIGAVVKANGELTAVHRIYLTTDGHKANLQSPKKLLGQMQGGAVRLGDAVNTLVIAEGIETALAARELTNLPAWATVSAIGMLKVELPANIRQVYIAIDADASGTGERAGNSLARRLKAEGREVWILDPRSELGPLPLGCKGFDWLDVLNAKEAAASNAS